MSRFGIILYNFMDKPQKILKVAEVKNKAPAEIELHTIHTAEQLLREAKECDLEIVPPPPKQNISDPVELRDNQHRERHAFEDNIRSNHTNISNWIKYAAWEECQNEIQRARSIYERALDIDHQNILLWLKYAELEMRHQQVMHARNIWDRAVFIMPRINKFWYKYTSMEEMLDNVAGARAVFERWMEWKPPEQAWLTYIKFELRYHEVDRARQIYNNFVMVHPEVTNWIRYARFEEQNGFIKEARDVFEKAIKFFGNEHIKENLIITFAKFEECQKEYERVSVIYKYALDRVQQDNCPDIYKAYTMHVKKLYEEEVKTNPKNYNAWIDYLKLVESEGNVDIIRDTYKRAVANIPYSNKKEAWRRYVNLWINYVSFEDLGTGDEERTRDVYQTFIATIPHTLFTFSKAWLNYAQFEIRHKNLTAARKRLGIAIELCPRDKLFRGYIDLELQLKEFERSSKLYEKYLQFQPENCVTWIRFAELETALGKIDRVRAIYEFAVNQQRLDTPEVLWKSFIDFETLQGETERARKLYERLLERTNHIKVWLSYAQFEATSKEKDTDCVSLARKVFKRGNETLRRGGTPEEREGILQAWYRFEEENGNEDSKVKVKNMLPKRIKKRVPYTSENGRHKGWEEKIDYIFPENEAAGPNLKLLETAKAWKKMKMEENKNK